MNIAIILFCLSISGSDQERRTKIHLWKRESVAPMPQNPLTLVRVVTPQIAEEQGEEEITPQDLDAVEEAMAVSNDIDRYLLELRNQDENDEQPGAVERQQALRDVRLAPPVLVPLPQHQPTFWERVLEWCAYGRRRR